MKALFPLLLSSLLLFSCGTDEPQRPKDALHAAADAYPLITETRESYVIPISWRVPLIPRQLLTEMSDATRWLKLPPTEKNTVSFDVWIDGEEVNPHQRQKATFAKEFYAATGTELHSAALRHQSPEHLRRNRRGQRVDQPQRTPPSPHLHESGARLRI